MGRYDVKHKEQYACFTTVSDGFVTEFMDKDAYEEWRKSEYGNYYYRPMDDSKVKNIYDAAFDIRLSRNHEKAIECLLESGLSKEECESIMKEIELKHYCPKQNGPDMYVCPNCGKSVIKGQERCTNELCELKFVWF